MDVVADFPTTEDIHAAIEMVRCEQGHPPLKDYQVSTVVHLIQLKNCLNQLPTGYGKTWPVVSLPLVIDTLTVKFGYHFHNAESRVLYIVPLVNIYQSLALEMEKLNIPYQVMSVGSTSQIRSDAKVIFISPERLLNKHVMKSILDLQWSCISVDEPHLALEQGVSQSKNKKPFREAFSRLNHLNSLGTPFELHSATITNANKLFQMMGRKNSEWIKQLVMPERHNLTYFLYAGTKAPDSVLDLPIVIQSFEDNTEGLTLVYVQSIKEGSDLFITLVSYCYDHNLVKYTVRDASPLIPVAFLHSNLTEEKKLDIFKRANSCEVKVLIATSAAGAGINLPVRRFVGWGLDREPSGIVQSQGRTARSPYTGEGIIVWVHKPKLHGQRIPSNSLVRDLLKSKCLRKSVNSWFCHDLSELEGCSKPAEYCCNVCMAKCAETSGYQECESKLDALKPKLRYQYTSKKVDELSKFLESLCVNRATNPNTPKYEEKSLACEILDSLTENNEAVEFKSYLSIYNFDNDVTEKIVEFINSHHFKPNSCTEMSFSDDGDSSVSSGSGKDGSAGSEADTVEEDSEYYDSDD